MSAPDTQRRKLPPFTKKVECPKCGDDDIKSKYVDAEDDTMHTYRTVAVEPYILRTCPCGFRWAEEPLS